MKPSESIREGDDYFVSWVALGVGLHVFRLVERETTLRGLAVPIRLVDRKRLAAPQMVNLYEGASKERLAKTIAGRIDGEQAPNIRDWHDSMENAFGSIIDLFTQPDPLRILGREPRQPNQGYLVWPFLARNQVNILLADQGAGKSYIGLAIAQAVSAGRTELLPEPFNLLGRGPVIYYDAETDLPAQQERQYRLAKALGLDTLPDIHYRHIRPPLSNYASVLRRDVAEIGAVLTIFDSLTFLAGGNLNDSETANPTMNAIGECGAETTKLCLAHHGKAGRESGATPSVIGFSGFEFKARSIWIVKRMNDEGEGVTHIDQAWTNRKTNDDRTHRGFGLRVAFDEDNTAAQIGRLGFDESPWLAKTAGSPEDRIRAALVETEFYKANGRELATATGLSERHIRRVIEGMTDVRRVSGGDGRNNMSSFELHVSEREQPKNGSGKLDKKLDTYIDNSDVQFPADAETGLTGHDKLDMSSLEERARASLSGNPEEDDLVELPF